MTFKFKLFFFKIAKIQTFGSHNFPVGFCNAFHYVVIKQVIINCVPIQTYYVLIVP